MRYRSSLSDAPEAGVALPGPLVAGKLVDLAASADGGSGVSWLPPQLAPADLWASVGNPEADWRWGGAPAERIALRMADWLMAARERTPAEHADVRRDLVALQTSVHEAIRTFRIVDRARRAAESTAVEGEHPDGRRIDQATLVDRASEAWRPRPGRRGGRCCCRPRTRCRWRGRSPSTPVPPSVSRSGTAGRRAPSSAVESVAQRLLMADVAWRGMRGELADEHQASSGYEFLRVNAAAPRPFQRGSRVAGVPNRKLFGMQLGHFAGFVRASWRANDFMWGRLDGASGVVDLLLSERRLRLSPVSYAALAKIPGVVDPPVSQRGGDYLTGADPGELEAWRACIHDALSREIVDDELKCVVEYMRSDRDSRGFAAEPDLLGALEQQGSPQQRFEAYCAVLFGARRMLMYASFGRRVKGVFSRHDGKAGGLVYGRGRADEPLDASPARDARTSDPRSPDRAHRER